MIRNCYLSIFNSFRKKENKEHVTYTQIYASYIYSCNLFVVNFSTRVYFHAVEIHPCYL